jgi:hypothetical protein
MLSLKPGICLANVRGVILQHASIVELAGKTPDFDVESGEFGVAIADSVMAGDSPERMHCQ